MRPRPARSVSLIAIAAALSLGGPSLAQNQPRATPPADSDPGEQTVTVDPPAPAAPTPAPVTKGPPPVDNQGPPDGSFDTTGMNDNQGEVAAPAGPGFDWALLLLALVAGIGGGLLSRVLPRRRPRSDGATSEKTLEARVVQLEWDVKTALAQRRPAEPPAPEPDEFGRNRGLASLHRAGYPSPPSPPVIPDNAPYRMDGAPDVGPSAAPVPPPPPPPSPEDSRARQSDQALQDYVTLANSGAKPAELAEVIRRFERPLALRLDAAGGFVAESFVSGDANQFLVALGDGRSFAVLPTFEYISDFAPVFSQAVQNPPVVRELFELDPDGSGELRIVAPARVTIESGVVQMQHRGQLSGFRS